MRLSSDERLELRHVLRDIRRAFDKEGFSEGEHPRGQPGNPGQFAPVGGSGGSSATPSKEEATAAEKIASKHDSDQLWEDYGSGAAIKEATRGTPTKAGSTTVTGEVLSEAEAAKINAAAVVLQHAAATSKTKHNVLHRGTVYASKEAAPKFKRNDPFEFESLTATSPDRGVAGKYADPQFIGEDSGFAVIYRISAAGPMEGYDRQSEEGFPETLIPKGAQYKVGAVADLQKAGLGQHYGADQEGVVVDLYRPQAYYRKSKDEAGFSENEHPRGQPNNPGQFAPKAGGGSSKKQDPEKRSDIRQNLTVTSPTDPGLQPVKSVDELYERAKKAEPIFKSEVEAIAHSSGGTVKYTPEQYAEPGTILKSRSSAERKLTAELGGDAGLLRDVLRATVLHPTIAEARAAAADFIKEQGGKVLRVKDRIVAPVGGYRDMLVNYRTAEGLVAEVQFNAQPMLDAKEGEGHKIYESIRELTAFLEGKTPATVAKIEELEREQTAVYHKAYLASGNGNWAQA